MKVTHRGPLVIKRVINLEFTETSSVSDILEGVVDTLSGKTKKYFFFKNLSLIYTTYTGLRCLMSNHHDEELA